MVFQIKVLQCLSVLIYTSPSFKREVRQPTPSFDVAISDCKTFHEFGKAK